jgi:hypothetical protein
VTGINLAVNLVTMWELSKLTGGIRELNYTMDNDILAICVNKTSGGFSKKLQLILSFVYNLAKYMMVALTICLSYAQTLWLKMHLKRDKCRASSEPFLIAQPRNLSQTLQDTTIMTYC